MNQKNLNNALWNKLHNELDCVAWNTCCRYGIPFTPLGQDYYGYMEENQRTGMTYMVPPVQIRSEFGHIVLQQQTFLKALIAQYDEPIYFMEDRL